MMSEGVSKFLHKFSLKIEYYKFIAKKSTKMLNQMNQTKFENINKMENEINPITLLMVYIVCILIYASVIFMVQLTIDAVHKIYCILKFIYIFVTVVCNYLKRLRVKSKVKSKVKNDSKSKVKSKVKNDSKTRNRCNMVASYSVPVYKTHQPYLKRTCKGLKKSVINGKASGGYGNTESIRKKI